MSDEIISKQTTLTLGDCIVMEYLYSAPQLYSCQFVVTEIQSCNHDNILYRKKTTIKPKNWAGDLKSS